jgi:uncharacterized protein with HEPN domain
LRDPRIDLERMVICAEKVGEYAGALTFEEFVHDGLRYDATLRNLEIMGEAAKRVSEAVRERFRRYRGVIWLDSGIGSPTRTTHWMIGSCGTRCDAVYQ